MLPNVMVTSWAQFIQPLSDSENSELSQASLSSEDHLFSFSAYDTTLSLLAPPSNDS